MKTKETCCSESSHVLINRDCMRRVCHKMARKDKDTLKLCTEDAEIRNIGEAKPRQITSFELVWSQNARLHRPPKGGLKSRCRHERFDSNSFILTCFTRYALVPSRRIV